MTNYEYSHYQQIWWLDVSPIGPLKSRLLEISFFEAIWANLCLYRYNWIYLKDLGKIRINGLYKIFKIEHNKKEEEISLLYIYKPKLIITIIR